MPFSRSAGWISTNRGSRFPDHWSCAGILHPSRYASSGSVHRIVFSGYPYHSKPETSRVHVVCCPLRNCHPGASGTPHPSLFYYIHDTVRPLGTLRRDVRFADIFPVLIADSTGATFAIVPNDKNAREEHTPSRNKDTSRFPALLARIASPSSFHLFLSLYPCSSCSVTATASGAEM